MAWVQRIRRWAPVITISQELVRFDLQQIQHPEISGIEYQHGTLMGYEIREYLLEKWGRHCAYCGAHHVPLKIEHIHPRSKGGSNRVSNLTIACHACNQRKGSRGVAEFLASKPETLRWILAQAKAPLRDAAAVNSTRCALFQRLKATDLDVEVGTGGRTKRNRHQLQVPKAHCLDAACVGHVDVLDSWSQPVLRVTATGRGSYQRTRLTKQGFPRGYLTRSKRAFGFQTGDLVTAGVTTGQKVGSYRGRVAIRASGSFNVQTPAGLVQGISHRFCALVQRADGYGYSWTQIALQTKGGTGNPGLNAGVSRATIYPVIKNYRSSRHIMTMAL